jgi:hypothetical protein
MLFDGLWYSVNCNADSQKPKAEQHSKQDLAPCVNASRDDDWNRKYYEYGIDDCAANSHGEELCHTLTALRSWIRNDLPVVRDWLAFGQSAHYDGHKGSRKNAS